MVVSGRVRTTPRDGPEVSHARARGAPSDGEKNQAREFCHSFVASWQSVPRNFPAKADDRSVRPQFKLKIRTRIRNIPSTKPDPDHPARWVRFFAPQSWM